MSPSLREIQEYMLETLRRGESLAEQPELARAAALVARGNERLSPAEQVDIYREQFFLRHVDCLREDFPALEGLLGCHAFDDLARAYLAAHPPSSFSLRDLGHELPAYLARAEAAAPAGPPGAEAALLTDMARIEWALVDAFDAADVPALDPARLQELAPDDFDRAVLTFDPSLTLLALRYPVHLVHEAASEGLPFEPPGPQATWLGVYRRLDAALDWHPIPELAHRTLLLLRQGLPLSDALDRVASSLTEQGELELLTASVGGWFSDWVQRGWIRAVTPTPV